MAPKNTNSSKLLIDFFKQVDLLKRHKIICSDRFLGDIGEFIAIKKYKLKPSSSKREQYIDGTIGRKKVQVKFSSSPTKTNINVGNPNEYDELILVLASQSMHFPDDITTNFVVYKIASTKILKQISKSDKGKYYCTKETLKMHKFDSIKFEDLDY